MSTFVRHLMDPRPLVTVSGHFGNFEVAGILGGLMGFPSFAVARPLDNPLLDRFVNRFRQRTGQFILPKRGSAKQIDALLQQGGTLMLLGDQAAGPNGCWVEFFGRPASCHKAVALFSLVNRAPMMLSYCRRLDRPMQFELGITAVFDPQIDEISGVKELTQWYSEQLEQMIRQAPGQYWWLHRRWKSRPRAADRSAAIRRPSRRPGPPSKPDNTEDNGSMSEYICIANCSDCPPGESREAGGRRPPDRPIQRRWSVLSRWMASVRIKVAHWPKGQLCGHIVTCPWHGWQFDVRDGQHQIAATMRQPTIPLTSPRRSDPGSPKTCNPGGKDDRPVD